MSNTLVQRKHGFKTQAFENPQYKIQNLQALSRVGLILSQYI
jgi:hypothetical protein